MVWRRQSSPQDVGRAMRISQRLEFGTVWINDHIPLASEGPHGGFKQSGFGKDLSIGSGGRLPDHQTCDDCERRVNIVNTVR
jgi:hypothetical protein